MFVTKSREGGDFMKKNHEIPKWAIEFRTFCMKEGLTSREVSERTGIGSTSLSYYRTGRRRPTAKACNKIKEGIGFDMYKALYEAYLEEKENEDGKKSEV